MTRSKNPPESWAPVRRAANAIASPIQRVLEIEAASGILLLAAAVGALAWANLSPASYEAVWHTSISAGIGSWTFDRPLHFWINDGLMTVFFFLVGLEIRREMFAGELATGRQAAAPLLAAVGGMLLPAALFASLNFGRAGAPGWAIPMATDIAFAVGILTLLGSRVPPSLRVLLLGIAVIDDIGAILVIALFYSTGIGIEGLLIVVLGIVAVLTLRTAGVRLPLLYVVPGVVVWLGFSRAGIHPTIAGVVLGLLTPVRPWFGPSGFAATAQEELDQFPDDPSGLSSRLERIDHARREVISPGERLINSIHPWVAFLVMPVFALANAGIVIEGGNLSGDSWWLFIGVIAGLVLGKPLGIAVAALAARRIGSGETSRTVRGIVLVGLVGGIGFTMSLFIAQLAFPKGPLLDTAKLAILVGSGVAIVSGFVFGRLAHRDALTDVSTPIGR